MDPLVIHDNLHVPDNNNHLIVNRNHRIARSQFGFTEFAEPGKRIGHVSVCYEGKLIVWGGYNDEFTHRYLPPDQIWVFDPLSEKWSSKKCVERLIPVKDMPTGTSGASACLIDSHMYIFGGYTDDGNTSSLYRVNLSPLRCHSNHHYQDALRTSSRASSPTGDHNHNGHTQKALPQVTFDKLRPDNHELTPIACDKSVSWTYKGRVYIFGGYGLEPTFAVRSNMPSDFFFLRDQSSHWHYQRGWNNQLVCYDPATNEWSYPKYQNQAPCPRAAHAMAQIGHTIYICGGRSGADRLDDLWSLDMETLTWTEVLPVSSDAIRPEKRSWHSFTAINDTEIILYGGLSNNCEPLKDCWIYDVPTNQWRLMDRPSEPRLWHTAVFSPMDREILIYGGGTQNILNYRLTNTYTNDLITLRFSPKSLLRCSLDAAVAHHKLLSNDYHELPRYLQLLIADRRSSPHQQIAEAGS